MKDLTLNDFEELRAALSVCIDALDRPPCRTRIGIALKRAKDAYAGSDTLLLCEPTAPFILSDCRVLLTRELYDAGPGFRPARVILADHSTERKREYVVARHYGGDNEWTGGNYFRTLAQAAEKFDSMTAALEDSREVSE